MKSLYFLVGIATLAAIALVPSCSNSGLTGACNGGNCTGCCATNGICEPGETTTFCGTGGGTCQACSSGQTCHLGTCVNGNGSDSGSTGCSNCAGCCASNGTCITTSSDLFCGTGGSACKSCGNGQSCMNGTCQGGCTPTCSGVMCGNSDGCGGTCTPGDGCVEPPDSGTCNPTCSGKPCGSSDGCGGTCQAGGGCIPPDGGSCNPTCIGIVCGNPNACGTTCTAGSGCTTGTCNFNNCTGCCPSNGGACVQLPPGGESASQCGQNGATCTSCPSGDICSTSGTCVTAPNLDGGLNCTTPSTSFASCTAGCGTYRWDVKTGKGDTAAGSVNLSNIKLTTVAALNGLTAETPNSNGSDPRGGPSGTWAAEFQVYELKNVILANMRTESDCDYHMVINDNGSPCSSSCPSTNCTLVAEIPFPGCESGSPWYCYDTHARAALEAAFGVPPLTPGSVSPQQLVTIVGVAYYDKPCEATGSSSNNIEIHPVLAWCTGMDCDPFSN
jgi:hypothetical protein